jgi:hypothetical protein
MYNNNDSMEVNTKSEFQLTFYGTTDFFSYDSHQKEVVEHIKERKVGQEGRWC